MKELIIGIDGGDQRILEAFDMPFVHSLLKDGYCQKLEEDIFSRGWAEIMTGEHASKTGAFYMHPQLDDTRDFTIAFSMSQVEQFDDVTPIWDLINKAGLKAGIMNVPTSTPAPKHVNGFVIGSGGGGLNKVQGVPETLCSSVEVKKFLDVIGYIVDLRLTSSGITETDELFQRLDEMEKKRAEAYVELAAKDGCDVGFFCNRGTTIVQYIFMSEIEAYIASKEMGDELHARFRDENPMHQLLEAHYKNLDECIRNLVENLKPEHLILTADHGTVPYKHRACVRPFLEENGYFIKRQQAKKSLRRRLSSLYTSIFGNKAKAKLAKKLPASVGKLVSNVDWSKTKAFGNRYINGIYLNDARFRGPVKPQEFEGLVKEICDRFNASKDAQSYGLEARAYRSEYIEERYSDGMPDVIIEGLNGLFFDTDGPALVYLNKNYGPVPDLSQVKEDMFTGQKSIHPLFCTDKKTAELIEEGDPNDLRLVYKLTERIVAS